MKISVFTLGCKTNLYESLQLVANLKTAGYEAFEGLKRADVFVINTCAITSEAEKKSRQAISRARKLNQNCKVIVVGCASQKSAEQFADIENVVFVKGVANKEKLLDILQNIEQADCLAVDPIPSDFVHSVDADQQRTRAFLKIQDGCNNFCTYCIVPYLRGRSRSKNICDIVREVKNVEAHEVVLIGIDISQFGKDNNQSLVELFLALENCGKRIRLGSLENSVVTDEFLQATQKIDFCPHFHLSLQSGCDSVLKRMNRHYTTAEFLKSVKKIRQYYENCAITTDVIVGFSGETKEEFETTCQFVQQCKFADIHVFPYSKRKGTVAYNLPDVDTKTKKLRAEILGEIKQDLKKQFLLQQLGTTQSVLCEEQKGSLWTGYTKNYVRVYFESSTVQAGELADIKLTELFKDGAKGQLL